ncbi:MAG: DMT family transporter [Candidatus Micrarchaeota archaeon]
MAEEKGILLALLTAFVSGFSVFVNSFGVQGMDPFVYTTLKNAAVALFIISGIYLLKQRETLAKLTKKEWIQLAIIGVIGGSVPFLLFFLGLKMSGAVTSSFIYRLLFVFAGVFAWIGLKERVSRSALIGAGIAILGNALLVVPYGFKFGAGEALVLGATVLWAAEYVISKKVLTSIPSSAVAFGRMFFGSLVLIAFLAFTGGIGAIATLGTDSWMWVGISSALLTAFVLCWYTSLKHTSVTNATAILALGGPITTLLSYVFLAKGVALADAVGLMLLVIGVVAVVGFGTFARSASYARKQITIG